MSAKAEISAPMAAALALAAEHDGKLVRYAGGYWSWRGCPCRHDGVPQDYFGTTTINGLVARGCLRWTKVRAGRGGEFPIEAEIVPSCSTSPPGGRPAPVHPVRS
jgi:hypothetical protein